MAEYIEREQTIRFAGYSAGLMYKRGYLDEYYALEKFKGTLGRIPAADVAPVVHGHWCKELVPFRDKLGNQHFGSCCSKCGGIFNRTKFCGGCGAKMDEEG